MPFLKRYSHNVISFISSVCFEQELTRGKSVTMCYLPVEILVRKSVKYSLFKECYYQLNCTQSYCKIFHSIKDIVIHQGALGQTRERNALSFQQSWLLTNSNYESFFLSIFFRLMSSLNDCKSDSIRVLVGVLISGIFTSCSQTDDEIPITYF